MTVKEKEKDKKKKKEVSAPSTQHRRLQEISTEREINSAMGKGRNSDWGLEDDF